MYLEGAAHPIQVYTHHKNLEYFSGAKTTSRRHARWAATLAAYHYTITYRKGATNVKLDTLSRRSDLQPPPLPSLPIIPPPATTPYTFPTPYLIGAAVLVRPDKTLFLKLQQPRRQILLCTQSTRSRRSWRGVKPRIASKQPIGQFVGSVCD